MHCSTAKYTCSQLFPSAKSPARYSHGHLHLHTKQFCIHQSTNLYSSYVEFKQHIAHLMNMIAYTHKQHSIVWGMYVFLHIPQFRNFSLLENVRNLLILQIQKNFCLLFINKLSLRKFCKDIAFTKIFYSKI